jgi:ABC-type multidrug transport system ATPase subunit
VIRAQGLEKRYGRKRVLHGVDLSVARDELLLVTGPNGSGKTTLLRLCAGLALPSRGTLEFDVDRSQLGYLGHESLLYRVPERRERIGMLLERFGLWEVRAERVGAYSRGMTQRLALCRVLLHDPALVVLDEPYTALDEEGAELLDRELAALVEGRALLVSTHDPARVEPLATGRLALA